MNWLDIVILVLLVIATLIGLRIGIIKAALSLAGLIIGIILAGHYYAPFSHLLSFIPNQNAAEIAAFAIIVIGVMIIAAVLASLLKRLTSIIMLGWIDRIGGAVFGLVLGAILYSALLAIWVNSFGMNEIVAGSALSAILLYYFPMVLALLPEEFDAIRSFFQ